MAYQSIDQFLTAHKGAITGLMEVAQREVGGHYAAMTSVQLKQNAANDAAYLIESLKKPADLPTSYQEIARSVSDQGIAVEELIRLTEAMNRRLVPYIEEYLKDDADLCAELLRRLNHLNARFNAGVRTVQIDDTIRRLTNPPPRKPRDSK
jgi:hypothetical protein